MLTKIRNNLPIIRKWYEIRISYLKMSGRQEISIVYTKIRKIVGIKELT